MMAFCLLLTAFLVWAFVKLRQAWRDIDEVTKPTPMDRLRDGVAHDDEEM